MARRVWKESERRMPCHVVALTSGGACVAAAVTTGTAGVGAGACVLRLAPVGPTAATPTSLQVRVACVCHRAGIHSKPDGAMDDTGVTSATGSGLCSDGGGASRVRLLPLLLRFAVPSCRSGGGGGVFSGIEA